MERCEEERWIRDASPRGCEAAVIVEDLSSLPNSSIEAQSEIMSGAKSITTTKKVGELMKRRREAESLKDSLVVKLV